jgi:hypothetical protein
MGVVIEGITSRWQRPALKVMMGEMDMVIAN